MTDVIEQIASYSFSFLHAFFFLELSCVTSLFLSFFSFLFKPFFLFFFSFGVALFFFSFRCWTFLLFDSEGCRTCSPYFWSFPCFLFSGALCFLSLSLDRLNNPLRNRFVLVLSRFSDRLRGTLVTHQKPYHERYAQVLAPNMSMLSGHIHEYGHVRNRHVMFITIEYIKTRNLKTRNYFLFRCETFLLTLS